jgi:hypothetical protein
VTLELLLVAVTAPAPPQADSLLSVVLAVIGLTLFALGLGVIVDRKGRQEGQRMTHGLTFARRIAAEPKFLDHLKKQRDATTADIQPGWRTLEVPGGVLASPCDPGADHEEVMGCWAFYTTVVVH